MNLTLANLNLDGKNFEEFKLAEYYTVRDSLVKWLVHEIEEFNFGIEGLYGTQKAKVVTKLIELAEEYETSCPDFSCEIQPLAKFLSQHPIFFAY